MTDSNPVASLVTVQFQPSGRHVIVHTGTTLLAAAREAGIGLLSVCGGAGLCDSCRVRIVRGAVPGLSDHERDVLDGADLQAGFRLACQVVVAEDLVVDVPADSVGTEQRLQLECDEEISRLAFDDADSAVGVRDVGEANARDSVRLGLAVDIGTTKIAAYLVALESRRTVAGDAMINPQVTFGEDVISRIAYADRTPGGAATLHDVLMAALNELASALCAQANVTTSAITEAVIVGNTVMHHLACGFPVAQLGRAPYAPAVKEAVRMPARDVGLQLASDAELYLPPNLAGYVGADHVAVLLSVGAPAAGRSRLVIDIGTNTEISLLADGRILSCSCASGPAFEGAHIGCGMRAVTGAIERVRIIGHEVRCQTIGDKPPIGICGSGVLDAVAEVAADGVLDRHGAFRAGHPLVSDRDNSRVLVLAPAAATGHNREIVLTRKDITEIQLAKAAIRSGIDVLLARACTSADRLDEVVVAGAFGSYIDLASARRVRMLPNLPAGRFRQVGNAAGAGARQLLVSRARRRAAEAIATRVEYIDLTTDPSFTETFASALAL